MTLHPFFHAVCIACALIAMSINQSARAADTSVPKTPFSAALDADLSAIASDAAHPLASLSVLAIRNGRVVYQQQFGRRHIDSDAPGKSLPADAATMYRIASISKLVTTLGVMKLIEDGKLALDTDISDYLGYRLRNPHFPDDAITLRMLLIHTSSLRDDAGYYWAAPLALKEVLLPGGSLYGNGAMWAANARPGAYFSYANLPWGVIGTIMERVTGERFDRLMTRLILQPMNLHGGFNPADFPAADIRNVATLYRKRTEVADKEIWNPAGPWVPQVDDYSKQAPEPRAGPDYAIGSNGTLFGPQGGLRISAADLGSIMLMLMNDGNLNGQPILKKQTVDLMLFPQWHYDAAANGDNYRGLYQAWGLGNQQFLDVSSAGSGDRLVENGGFSALGHLGDAWGLTSAFAFNRSTKNGVIFMTGGPGFDPEKYRGKYSSLYRHEERILTTLYRNALVGHVK